jgi:hypothetical protein
VWLSNSLLKRRMHPHRLQPMLNPLPYQVELQKASKISYITPLALSTCMSSDGLFQYQFCLRIHYRYLAAWRPIESSCNVNGCAESIQSAIQQNCNDIG